MVGQNFGEVVNVDGAHTIFEGFVSTTEQRMKVVDDGENSPVLKHELVLCLSRSCVLFLKGLDKHVVKGIHNKHGVKRREYIDVLVLELKVLLVAHQDSVKADKVHKC